MRGRKYEVGVLYGEGIGYEIIEQAKKVLNAISTRFNIDFEYVIGPQTKTPVKNKRGLVNQLYSFYDCSIKNKIPVLSGALSGGLVYSIRKRFDLFCKLVPIQSIPGYRSEVYKEVLDILLIRQNNTGEYFGKHGFLKSKNNTLIAFQNIRYYEKDIDKMASVAFEYALRRRQKVTLLLKEDGLPEISSLWRETFKNNHRNYKSIELGFLNVDTGAGELISNPSDFDIVVTLNSYGDIICDVLVSFIYGSRGMGCSGNFDEQGFASYQTVHGGAIDLVGKNKANPIGQILSAAMMLQYSFGLDKEAQTIKNAIETILNDGYRTEDIFESGCKVVSTQKMGSLITEAILKY